MRLPSHLSANSAFPNTDILMPQIFSKIMISSKRLSYFSLGLQACSSEKGLLSQTVSANSFFIVNGVGQGSNAFDLDLDHITGT